MADKTLQQNNGGQYASTHVAGASGAGSALTGAGRLCKLIVISQGSAATSIYDATSATGTPIFTLPASGTTAVATGVVYDLQIPVATGIYVGGASNTSAVTITYAKDGVNGTGSA